MFCLYDALSIILLMIDFILYYITYCISFLVVENPANLRSLRGRHVPEQTALLKSYKDKNNSSCVTDTLF